ncbi:Redoxin [Panaeolus papilionaceus]|nr:Redoxin [Panaeolus papilionaceus]
MSIIAQGATIPAAEVKENAPDSKSPLDLSGRNVLIGVPGAFTTPCNGHLPEFISKYDQFKAKGVNNVYVFAVNDTFVTKAWREFLAPEGTGVRFIADDQGNFVKSLGLQLDASGLLGGLRSKRWAIIADDGKVTKIFVEEAPPNVTVTAAGAVLGEL